MIDNYQAFRKNGTLRQHVACVHNGEKNFGCPVCAKVQENSFIFQYLLIPISTKIGFVFILFSGSIAVRVVGVT